MNCIKYVLRGLLYLVGSAVVSTLTLFLIVSHLQWIIG